MTTRFTGLWLLCLLFPAFAVSQDFSQYQQHVFEAGGGRLPYRLLPPADNAGKKYPLVIFLHGAFEKGDDNTKQLSIGGRFFLRDSVRKNYPAFIVFPQCPEDDSWAYFENTIDFETGNAKDWVFPFHKTPTPVATLLKQLIDSFVHSGAIDTGAVYIAGLSQGGMGVLDMIARYPSTFAAGISMCGAGDPATSRLFAGKVALWLFHGEKDVVVPPEFSRSFARKLKKEKNTVRYNEYPGVGHDCWNKAFAEPDLLRWLFLQRKD